MKQSFFPSVVFGTLGKPIPPTVMDAFRNASSNDRSLVYMKPNIPTSKSTTPITNSKCRVQCITRKQV